MRHSFFLEGYGFCLRPIRIEDAQFVIDVRLEDNERGRYIHPISADRCQQEAWLEEYFQRAGDYYFVIENRFTGEREGLIAFYGVNVGCAEWGRWIVRKGSLAAVESVYLLYRIAFEQAGLTELYCRTVADNKSVVSFHNSIGEKTRRICPKLFTLNERQFDAVEQYSDRQNFYGVIAPKLEQRAGTIAKRLVQQYLEPFEFHHIGVATRTIQHELPIFTLMGYQKEGDFFEDEEQGVRGVFLTSAGHPRLELLENIENAHTLDPILAHRQKLYHTAYYVRNIEKAVSVLVRNKAKLISPAKYSKYFQSRICFLYLPNMEMIELLELK